MMNKLSCILVTALTYHVFGKQEEDYKLQSRFYTFTRGNFTQYVEKFIDPWLIFVAPTGKIFDDRVRENVKNKARKYRGMIKVGLLFVSSKDDVILRKYGNIGFTELNEEWILCLPYGKSKDTSSSFLSERRAFRRCMKSIPATVHEISNVRDLNELTFNAIVKFSPARFLLLAVVDKELDFMKVAAQRYKNYFMFATMDPKHWTAKIASEYSIGMSEEVTGFLFLFFMEREVGKGFVKKAVSVGPAERITSYPDAIELLFRLNILYRRRLPGIHGNEGTCDPHQYMSGIMAVEKKWFPRFIQILDNSLGCGSLIRKKLDSMSVPLVDQRSKSFRTEL